MALLISSYASYVALSFLPPIVWLLFYLHEDRHPEPKRLIILTFAAGIIAALGAAAIEVVALARTPQFSGVIYHISPYLAESPWMIFAVVAVVEEYCKYFAVKTAVLSRSDFDEPIDAMIYLVTAALGFAAIENALFSLEVFRASFQDGIQLTLSRFLGANLLHALSSAIVGYFVARHFFSPWRKHAIAVGIFFASILHMLFNYIILIKAVVPEVILFLVLLLTFMTIVVFVDFQRLKRADEPRPTS